MKIVHFFSNDRLAIFLSSLCLVHCIVSPLIMILAPAFLSYWDADWVHPVMFLLVFPLALWSLYSGKKHHKKWTPSVLGFIGIIFLILGMVFHDLFHHDSYTLGHFTEEGHLHGEHLLEIISSVIGGFTLALAHYLNMKSCHHCHHHPHP
jgi:energy-coupling factor transporter transmembrane protein EcfT